MDRATIAAANARSLGDLLRGVPGVRVVPSGLGYQYQSTTSNVLTVSASSPSKTDYVGPGGAKPQLNAEEKGCDLMFVIDGFPVTRDENIDLLVRPAEITALEVYATASSVPRQFAGVKSACGVVVFDIPPRFNPEHRPVKVTYQPTRWGGAKRVEATLPPEALPR